MLGIPKKWWGVAVAVAVTLVLVLYFRKSMTDRWAADSLKYAQSLLDTGNAQGAYETADEVLRKRPRLTQAAMLGAEACVQLKKYDRAVAFLDHVIAHSKEQRAEASGFRGMIYIEQRKLAAAEASFREALRFNPDYKFAREQLCSLLLLYGRRQESLPLRFEILRDGDALSNITLLSETLILLGSPDAIVNSRDVMEACMIAEPDNPFPHLAIGRLLLRDNKIAEARKELKIVVEKRPDCAEAQAQLGHTFLSEPEEVRERELLAWNRALPKSALDHPEVWVVRGLWSQQRRDWSGAVRCFWEALKRQPNHGLACYQLAVSLAAAGDASSAAPFQKRALALQELAKICDQLHESGGTISIMARAAELNEEMGRFWEAEGWTRVVLSFEIKPDPKRPPEDRAAQLKEDQAAHDKALAIRRRVSDRLDPKLPQVHPDYLIADKVDLSRYPLPNFEQAVKTQHHLAAADLNRLPHFREVTQQAGIDFQYYNGDDPKTDGRRMFEFTGGGAAAFDFDQDGWPDLYFTQGCEWPPDPRQTKFRDRLYRNLGNGRFEDVTDRAGMGDNRFSQGVAAGDYDNDGWPDLLVCNVGQNSLYHNNGDGTFTEVAAPSGLQADLWSTSAAIADLDGDGNPDIYQVNYLQGGRAFELICNREGKARSCSPTEFDAEQDQLFWNDGTGRFQDGTQTAGIVADQGKGLGCVVADFSGDGRLSVFVANDTTANFLFVPDPTAKDRRRFSEQALLLGTAFDREGRAQACMGIAVDDSDGDGRLDLFVTNFYNEPNAFYHQQEGGGYLDESSGWGLSEASLKLLGFGTQFLDGELDGLPDLVITNGHVDDFTHTGEPFQMPPQYYRNLGGRFVEWPATDLGEYFSRKMLGRGMALVDYNRDGREDFVVSSLDVPVSLVENDARNAGHHLCVQLVGRAVARDAFGTWVTATAGDTRRIRQLTAGSGYHASNQRQLIFGLGPHETVDTLEIRWPDGTTQTLKDIPADQQIRVIQQAGWYVLPRDEVTAAPG